MAGNRDCEAGRGEGGTPKNGENRISIKSGKPHGNSRLAKIGIPELRVKGRPGAPKGNRNAWKSGLHSAGMKDLRRRLRVWRHRAAAAIDRAEAELKAEHSSDCDVVSASSRGKVTRCPLPPCRHDVLHDGV